MLLLSALAVIGGYALLASWAYRIGGEYVIACAGAALLLIACGALLLAARYDVPSTSRLMVYMLGFAGPVVVVPTALLLLLPRASRFAIAPLAVAIAGAALGFVLGFLFVVFGMGMWS
jgi:hypothetical protein